MPSRFAHWATRVTAWIGRPWLAVALAALAAAATLLPALGSPGLWEPQELAAADAALARVEADRKREAQKAPPPAPPDAASLACPPARPPDAVARTFSDRALRWTVRNGQASERALRLPMALMGLLTVLATAGLAARLAGARAALLTALLLLSFPLLVLQSRQITAELGTAAGAALTLYGLVSLRPIGHTLWRAVAARHHVPQLSLGVLHLFDDLLSLLALGLGLVLGFVAGGALLGTLVPVLAFAAASGLGARGLLALGRLARNLARRAADAVVPSRRLRAAGEPVRPSLGSWLGDPSITWLGMKGLVATLVALAVFAVMLGHAYKLGPLTPGTRQVFGHSILPTQCYSWALGGVWQGSDDLRVFFDSSVEQIAFGTFPWGLLAPLAVLVLMASKRRPQRLAGALCLAWATIAWVATEAFQRKVGYAVYAGFPALALAVGLWLDAALTWARTAAARDRVPLDGAALDAAAQPADAAPFEPTPNDDDDAPGAWRARLASPLSGRLLLGLFFLLGAITLGKDLQTFPERLSSLLYSEDAIKYPALARFLWIPTRAWVLVLGAVIALSASVWMWTSVASPARRRAEALPGRRALSIALAATAALAAFWVHGWHASLSRLLSSKNVFASYHALRAPGDRLVLYGELGNAPRYYAGGPFEQVNSREKLFTELSIPAEKTRVFALFPAVELCALHRQAGEIPYYVLDNDNARTLLLSNSKRGATDRNPLATSLYRGEPPGIANRPPGRIVFDDRIELIGWTIPKSVRRGERFTVTMYYRILAPVGGGWRVFQHYDRGGARFIGDHVPIDGRCPTSDWQTGDFIADSFTLAAGNTGAGPGAYDLWTGFFTGAAPSWRNMKLTAVPEQMRDKDKEGEGRVKLTTIDVR